jgi:hypothetical protein
MTDKYSPLGARNDGIAAARSVVHPQFQTAPIGVRVQHGPKLPPL